MQTHTKAYKFINEHLPTQYMDLVQKELKKAKINVTNVVVRNVRLGVTTTNVDVLNALLKVARSEKRKKAKLEAQLKEESLQAS